MSEFSFIKPFQPSAEKPQPSVEDLTFIVRFDPSKLTLDVLAKVLTDTAKTTAATDKDPNVMSNMSLDSKVFSMLCEAAITYPEEVSKKELLGLMYLYTARQAMFTQVDLYIEQLGRAIWIYHNYKDKVNTISDEEYKSVISSFNPEVLGIILSDIKFKTKEAPEPTTTKEENKPEGKVINIFGDTPQGEC